ncbi:MAG: tropomyosin, partial [Microlunatus sp.]|nr:tropomyosin [Microlunatus sp.]
MTTWGRRRSMCKSSSQPGGPYRCSGDMQQALERAQDSFDQALASTTDPYVAKTQAEHHLSRVSAMREAIESRDDLDAQQKAEQAETLAPAAQRWETALKTAEQDHVAAQAKVKETGQRMRQAQSDYDATPRGVAALQAEVDEQFDPSRPDVPLDAEVHRDLVSRRDAAIDQMNAESAERRQRWGTITGERVPIARMGDRPNSAEDQPYAALGAQDGLTATSVNHGYRMDSQTGQEFNDYEVTFFRPGSEGEASKSMRVTYRNHTSSEPPSQASVLAHMSAQAVGYETSRIPTPDGQGRHDFRRYCSQHKVSEDERD